MALSTLSFCVIHGPNLNLLGSREPEIYGTLTLNQINETLLSKAKDLNITLKTFQSNHEGEILDFIHEQKHSDGFLINPAALTHTSVALRDAILAINKPFVEVHLSQIWAREDFRKISYLHGVVKGVVCGFGAYGYELGLIALREICKK